MFTFFRRIRKEFLGNGSTSKYLYYAIGEILLVMVGILLALQVNNWNQDRINNIAKQEILETLYSNLEEDRIELEKHILWDSLRTICSALLLDAIDKKPINYSADDLNNLDYYKYSGPRLTGEWSFDFEIILSQFLATESSFHTRDMTFKKITQGNSAASLKNMDLESAISSYYNKAYYLNRGEDFGRDHITMTFAQYIMSDSRLTTNFDFLLSQQNHVINKIRRIGRSANWQKGLYHELLKELLQLKSLIIQELSNS